jgi:hypothetical protein
LSAAHPPLPPSNFSALWALLCYSYPSQEYCKKKKSELCTDKGEDWAVASESSKDTTAWTPKADASLGTGAGARAGEKFGCACLKNCDCKGDPVKCTCVRDGAQKAIGSDTFAFAFSGTRSAANAGKCACACGGVFGGGRAPTSDGGPPPPKEEEEEDYSTGSDEGHIQPLPGSPGKIPAIVSLSLPVVSRD